MAAPSRTTRNLADFLRGSRGPRARANGAGESIDSPYLYHVTYATNLEGIAERGLVPMGGSVGMGTYGAFHKGRGVFLTVFDGLSFWFGKAIEWAEHSSDRPLDEAVVPVVLRTPTPTSLTKDALGTRDALADAWIVNPVPSEEIEFWDGDEWRSIEEWESLDFSVGVTLEAQEPEEGDEGDGPEEGDEGDGPEEGDEGDGPGENDELQWLNHNSPLLPTEETT